MIDKEQVLFRVCLALIGLFRDQIESGQKPVIHTRIFNYVIHPEIDYVLCGRSSDLEPGDRAYGEHVVPCKVLVDECFRLIGEDTLDDDEIASLLQRHWKIAEISTTEAKRLDSDLGLKTKMPKGWRFEDGDTFARLNAANIVIAH